MSTFREIVQVLKAPQQAFVKLFLKVQIARVLIYILKTSQIIIHTEYKRNISCNSDVRMNKSPIL